MEGVRDRGIPEGRRLNQRWLNQKIFGCDSSVYINGVWTWKRLFTYSLCFDGNSSSKPYCKSQWIVLFYLKSVQFSCSVVSDSVTPRTATHQASLSFTSSRSLLKLMSITSVLPSNHLILCCTLLLPPSIPPSIRVFSNESVLHIRWPKYWSFSFIISPSNEYSGLISFRIDGWISLQSKALQASSSTPHFKSINYSALSFLYSPTLISVHDYWINHSFD